MGRQVLYTQNLPEIPSEFIEPYIQRFLMMQIESIAIGLITPQEARNVLNGVSFFVSSFGGVHSKYATDNVYGKFMRLTDEEIITTCKKYLKMNIKK